MVKAASRTGMVSSFTLAGFDWTVRLVEGLADYGSCSPATQEILIRAGMNEQTTSQTLMHELVHAILFTMGKTNHDEEFTDAFGALLHQYDKTKA